MVDLERILDGINFRKLGYPTEAQWGHAKRAAAFIQEQGPQDKHGLSTVLALGPDTIVDNVMGPGVRNRLFRSQRRSREKGSGVLPSLYHFVLEDARELVKKHPTPKRIGPADEADLSAALAALHELRTGLTTVQTNHLARAIVRLKHGPLETREIVKFLGINRDDAGEILNAGRRLKILRRDRHYCGRTNGRPGGQTDATWSHDAGGIRAFPTSLPRKPDRTWPIDALPPNQRKQIELIHFANDDLSETQAWNIANLIAMIRLAGGVLTVRRDELGQDHALNPSTLRGFVKVGETTGYIIVDRPDRKGQRKRPENTYRVNEEKLVSRRNGKLPERPLTPGRTLVTLGQVWPATERWTDDQKAIVEAIDQKIASGGDEMAKKLIGLSAELWRWARPILAATGDGIKSTYAKFALEFGCTPQQLETQIRKMKKAGWYRVQPDKSGATTKQSQLAADWKCLARVGGVKRKRKAAASKAAFALQETRSVAIPKPAPAKGGRPAKWDHVCEWISKYLINNPGSGQSKARNEYRAEFPDKPLPTIDQLRAALLRKKPPEQAIS